MFGNDEAQQQPGVEEIDLTANDVANIRTEEMALDRLSELPDCLLIHILSLLGTRRAAITSVLGKRWQFLWTELPELAFYLREPSASGKRPKAKHEFVAGVHKALATRSGKSLERLKVQFQYDRSLASDVDECLGVASDLKVKHVDLSLDCDGRYPYSMCKKMCSCSSLTSLHLRGCFIDPRREISWKSLQWLEVSGVFLPQLVVDNILSGCPALESLGLTECWGFFSLQTSSQNLRTLEVRDPRILGCFDFLEISAPYLKCLIIWFLPGKKLKLPNISSLESATFHFSGHGRRCSVAVLRNTIEMFENAKHVTELELGSDAIEALSVLLRNDWQLPKSTRSCLSISGITNDAETISCIVALLESSPDLEALDIECVPTRHGVSVQRSSPSSLLCRTLVGLNDSRKGRGDGRSEVGKFVRNTCFMFGSTEWG